MENNALMQMLGGAAQGEPRGGRADTVPAMLSEGEYVFPADVVAMIGDGNNDAGARVLDQIVEKIRMNYKGSKERPKDNQAFQGMMQNGSNQRSPQGSRS